MEAKKDFYQIVEEIFAQDQRYKPDSYEFLMQGLYFTQNRLKRDGHVSGKELGEGLKEFAIEQFGPMAQTVLKHWGVTKTEDFGNMVFNLIQKKILSKTEQDLPQDFSGLYDFSAAFQNVIARELKK